MAGLEPVTVSISEIPHVGVTLKDARFSDVFDALAVDLSKRIESAVTENEAVALFFGQLARWQKFLTAVNDELSAEAQRGLWGELRFLHGCLLPAVGGAAVAGWKGPEGSHQDFHFPSAWIEVKTTLAKQPQAVRITSERQLDDTHGPVLFLHVFMLEVQDGGSATLPALVSQVRAALNEWPAAREAFEDSLLSARYLDLHAHRYASTGYAVRQADSFRIGPGFPRLIERDLAPGVGDTSYLLSLAACTAFAAPTEGIVAALLAST
jgi:hypothetical protein